MNFLDYIPLIVTIVVAMVGSGGFWTLVQRRIDKKDARTKMILGLGHDRLLYLCTLFIERGELTADEFENIHEYLWNPYRELGGNGAIMRLMEKIDGLPIKRTVQKKEENK